MPIWVIVPCFGICLACTQLELPSWTIQLCYYPPQCLLSTVAFVFTLAPDGLIVQARCVVWVVCAMCVLLACLAHLLSLLSLGSFGTPALFCFVPLPALCLQLGCFYPCLRLHLILGGLYSCLPLPMSLCGLVLLLVPTCELVFFVLWLIPLHTVLLLVH